MKKALLNNDFKGINQGTFIGKDVIESLTIGMYDNALDIYREYIQNAADQIDKAVTLNILSKKSFRGFL